jgi:hypothetical protein
MGAELPHRNELAYEMVELAELGTAIAYETWPEWSESTDEEETS